MPDADYAAGEGAVAGPGQPTTEPELDGALVVTEASSAPIEAVAVPASGTGEIPLVPVVSRTRIPHLGHALILGVGLLAGLICAAILLFVGVHFHLFGVSDINQAARRMDYNLLTMLCMYVIGFVPVAALMPYMWRRSFAAGIQWNFDAVRQHWKRLVAVGVGIFCIAAVAPILFHFPKTSPIQQMLNSWGAAGMMFVFAVTVAPFFEELVFRGFLLPAFATAVDWSGEKLTGGIAPELGPKDHPRWSVAGMVVGSAITSVLFALLHASQTGHAWGPVVVLWCVSMVLCGVRLAARSVSASMVTHASYNFIVFLVILVGLIRHHPGH